MQPKMNPAEPSYAELQQQLKQAETMAERTLGELVALQKSQLPKQYADTPGIVQIQHQLQFMLKHAQRHNSGFALMFVQIDQFKAIRDKHDAAFTKKIIELTLQHLNAAVRQCDSISQLADDQFLVLVTDVSRIYDTVLVAEKLLQKLDTLHRFTLQIPNLTISIGISHFPEDGNDALLLIERATAAMLHAQHRGGNQFSLLR
ncbi:GGDEF domain-containing protein [Alkalimonas collagenimarina]|uniref:GGDEF domain-containing protein n=1 Tax=Alkalimonas collagenimarina TaxID=400390 RepID=A0ABT9GXI4_9GAMM|nr:GGDEF domain-containing protein [Alkalimonas collagenimarina]MDP4535776.1 GGDEF domain-containing protein [Alkalimonas collagenimarina]